MHFTTEISWFTLKSMRLTTSLTGKLGLGGSLAAEASYSGKYVRPWTVSMLRMKLKPITMMIGPVPVLVPWGFGVDLTPSFNLNLGGVIKDMNFEVKRTVTAYVAYEPARGGFIAGATGGTTELKFPGVPTMEVTGEVSGSLKLTFLFFITPYGIRESRLHLLVCLAHRLSAGRLPVPSSGSSGLICPFTTCARTALVSTPAVPVEFGVHGKATMKLGWPSAPGTCASTRQVRVEAHWGMGATVKVAEPTGALELWGSYKGPLRVKGWLPLEFSYDFAKDVPWKAGVVPGCIDMASATLTGIPPYILNPVYRPDPTPTRSPTRTRSTTPTRRPPSRPPTRTGTRTRSPAPGGGRRRVEFLELALASHGAGAADARTAAVCATAAALDVLLTGPVAAAAYTAGPFAAFPDSPICQSTGEASSSSICSYEIASQPLSPAAADADAGSLVVALSLLLNASASGGGWSSPDAACGPALRSRRIECVVSDEQVFGTTRVPLSYCKGGAGLPAAPPPSVQITTESACPVAASSSVAAAAEQAIAVSHAGGLGLAHRTVLPAAHVCSAGSSSSSASPSPQAALFAVPLPWATGTAAQEVSLQVCAQTIRLVNSQTVSPSAAASTGRIALGAGFTAAAARSAASAGALGGISNGDSRVVALASLWHAASAVHSGADAQVVAAPAATHQPLPGELPAALLAFPGAESVTQCITLTREEVQALSALDADTTDANAAAAGFLFVAVQQPTCEEAPAALVGVAAVTFSDSIAPASGPAKVHLSTHASAQRFLISPAEATEAPSVVAVPAPSAVALVLVGQSATGTGAAPAGSTLSSKKQLLAALLGAFRLHESVAIAALPASQAKALSWPAAAARDDPLAALLQPGRQPGPGRRMPAAQASKADDDTNGNGEQETHDGDAAEAAARGSEAHSAAQPAGGSASTSASPLLWDPAGCARASAGASSAPATATASIFSAAPATCAVSPALLTIVDVDKDHSAAGSIAVTASLTADAATLLGGEDVVASLLALPVYRASGRAAGAFPLHAATTTAADSTGPDIARELGPFALHELRSPTAGRAGGGAATLRHLILRVRLTGDSAQAAVLTPRFGVSFAAGDASSFEFRRLALQRESYAASDGEGWLTAVVPLSEIGMGSGDVVTLLIGLFDGEDAAMRHDAMPVHYELDAALVDHAPPYAAYEPLALDAGAQHHVIAAAHVPGANNAAASTSEPELAGNGVALEPLLDSHAAPLWFVGVQAEAPRGWDVAIDTTVSMQSAAAVASAASAVIADGGSLNWRATLPFSSSNGVAAERGPVAPLPGAGALLTSPVGSAGEALFPHVVLMPHLSRSRAAAVDEPAAAGSTAVKQANAGRRTSNVAFSAAAADAPKFGQYLSLDPTIISSADKAAIHALAVVRPRPLASSAGVSLPKPSTCLLESVDAHDDESSLPAALADVCCSAAIAAAAAANASISCAAGTLPKSASASPLLGSFAGHFAVLVPASSTRHIAVSVPAPTPNVADAAADAVAVLLHGSSGWVALPSATSSFAVAAAAGTQALHFTAVNCHGAPRLFHLHITAEVAGDVSASDASDALAVLLTAQDASPVSKRTASALAHEEAKVLLAAGGDSNADVQAASGCLAAVYRWAASDWSACPVCGGTASRRVWCEDSFAGLPATDALCAGHVTPETARSCGQPCLLVADEWSSCSPSCGPWAQRSRAWRCRAAVGKGSEVDTWRCAGQPMAMAEQTSPAPSASWFTLTVEHALCSAELHCPQVDDQESQAALLRLAAAGATSASPITAAGAAASLSPSPVGAAALAAAAAVSGLKGLAWRVGNWSSCDDASNRIDAQLQRRSVACVHARDAHAVRARMLSQPSAATATAAVAADEGEGDHVQALPDTLCEYYLQAPRPEQLRTCPVTAVPALAARLVAAPVFPLDALPLDGDAAGSSSVVQTKTRLLGDQAVTYLLPVPASVTPASAIGTCIRVEAIRSAPASITQQQEHQETGRGEFSTCTPSRALAMASPCMSTLAYCIADSDGGLAANDVAHLRNVSAGALTADGSAAGSASQARLLARGIVRGMPAGASYAHPAVAGLLTSSASAATCYAKAQVCLARHVCHAATTLRIAEALATECAGAVAVGDDNANAAKCAAVPRERWSTSLAYPLGGRHGAHSAALAVAADAPIFKLLAAPATIDAAGFKESTSSSRVANVLTTAAMFPVDEESSVWHARAVQAVPAAFMEAGAAFAVAYLPVLTSAAAAAAAGSAPYTSSPLLQLQTPDSASNSSSEGALQRLFLTIASTEQRGDTNLRLSLTAQHIFGQQKTRLETTTGASKAGGHAALLTGPLLSVGGSAVELAADFGAVPDTAIAAGGLTLTFTLHCDEVLLPSLYGAPFELGGSAHSTEASSRHWRSILRLLRASPVLDANAAVAAQSGASAAAGDSPTSWNVAALPRLKENAAVRVTPLRAEPEPERDSAAHSTAAGRRGRLLALETAGSAATGIPAADIFRTAAYSGRSTGLAGVRAITVTLPPIPGYAPPADELLQLGIPREYTASGSDVFLGGGGGLRIRATNRACVVSGFSAWSACAAPAAEASDAAASASLVGAKQAGAGRQQRSRAVLQEPTGTGAACPLLAESRACVIGATALEASGAGQGSGAHIHLAAGADADGSGFSYSPAAAGTVAAGTTTALRIAGGTLSFCLLLASVASVWAPLRQAAVRAGLAVRSRVSPARGRFQRLPQVDSEPSGAELEGPGSAAGAHVKQAHPRAAARPSRRRLVASGAALVGAVLVAVLVLTLGNAPAADAASVKPKRPAWFTDRRLRVFSNAPPSAPLGGAFAPPAAMAAQQRDEEQREQQAGSRRLSSAHTEQQHGVDPLAHWQRAGRAGAAAALAGGAASDGRRRLSAHQQWSAGQARAALRQLEHVAALNARITRMHALKRAAAAAGTAAADELQSFGSRRALHGDASLSNDEDVPHPIDDGSSKPLVSDDGAIDVTHPAHVAHHVLPTSHRYSVTLSADTILLDGGVGGESHPLVLRLVCPALSKEDGGVGKMEVHTVLHALPASADGTAHAAAAASAGAPVALADDDLGSLFVHPSHWRPGHILAGDHRWSCRHYEQDGMPAPFQREITAIRKAREETVALPLPAQAGSGSGPSVAPAASITITVWEVAFEEATVLDVLEDLDMSSALTPSAMRAHEAFAGSDSAHHFMPALIDGSVAAARARRLIKIHWGFSGGFDKTFRWEPSSGKSALVSSKHFNITCQGCFAQLMFGVKFEARFINFSPQVLDASVTIAPSARFALMLALGGSYSWSKQWELIDPILLFRLVLPAGPIPVPIPVKLHIEALIQLQAEARVILSNVGFAAGYSLTLGARYTPDTGFNTYRIAQPSLEIFRPTLDLYGAASLRVGPVISVTAGPFDVWNIRLGIMPYGLAYASTDAPACEKDSVQAGLRWGIDAFIQVDRPVIRIKLWIIKATIGELWQKKKGTD